MTIPSPCIVWFRQDLRLADNPALHRAVESGAPIIPLFILEDASDEVRAPGAAARWWLHHSLERLGESLTHAGAPLVLRRGNAVDILPALIDETGAGCVYWNDSFDPAAAARDETIRTVLSTRGVAVESFNATLLFDPSAIRSKAGKPFKVFTPFWRTLSTGPEPAHPLPTPTTIMSTCSKSRTEAVSSFKLLPTRPDWTGGIRESWTPGEAAATERLDVFLDEIVQDYRAGRDRPGRDGTSRLSPHLHWGEISPRQVWHTAKIRAGTVSEAAVEAFLREIGWREFTHGLLQTHPDLAAEPMDRRFAKLPWRQDPVGLKAWQRGLTGFPIVDAGMRQLWQTGWMHNRVRMIVGSFLVKDLLLPWQDGEAWFWDTLVDADAANNGANWQWVAGCGADPSPFFRVFNPVLQGEKFDPDGSYVRRFVPELTKLPSKFIHHPWDAPADVLAKAGIRLGKTYPRPIVDHAAARDRALDAFRSIRQTARMEADLTEIDLTESGQDGEPLA
jgi:deoxyribodipyrimidine photo-lyase